MSDLRAKRVLVLVEMDLPCDDSGRVILSDLYDDLVDANPGSIPVVQGIIQGVDAAFRKVRQLARETDEDAPRYDRVHSAQKTVSFFRDMFPRRFWQDKQIGEPHPEGGLSDERTERRMVR